jgi:CHAT domain-containing protein
MKKVTLTLAAVGFAATIYQKPLSAQPIPPPFPSQVPIANPVAPTNPTAPTINPVDLIKPQSPLNSLPPIQNDSIDTLKIDDSFSHEFAQALGLSETKCNTLAQARCITLVQVRHTLRQVHSATGIKPALIYAVFVSSTITPVPTSDQSRSQNSSGVAQLSLLRSLTASSDDRLELILITAEGEPIRKSVNATRAEVTQMAKQFRSAVYDFSNPSGYLAPAQKMYQWLVAPLEENLQQLGIKNLAYIMDTGLRSIPLAALHDSNKFIIERYSVGLMPSFSLTDTRYTNIRNVQLLAMGASHFSDQSSLPAVPIELSEITQTWQGKSFLNQDFTLDNLKSQRALSPFGIIHLATHADFIPGKSANSYIQLADTKLTFNQVRTLGWNKPPVELLVLSACRTALGDDQVQLGFAGLALQAGVKSALASLWYVSDQGTLGLITEFYQQLRIVPIKAEALRQAQVAMLRGQVRFKGGKLVTSEGEFPLPPELARWENQDLSHPFYWSGFTMVGNPW